MEVFVADLFRLKIEADSRGAFDAKHEGRPVEIKSTSGNRLHGVKRLHFDELFVVKLAWDIQGPSITHVYWMPNPPRSLGQSPSMRRFEETPNRLRKPIRLFPVPQRLKDGMPCYRSLRHLVSPLRKLKAPRTFVDIDTSGVCVQSFSRVG